MALVRPLKINADGHPEELDIASDDLEAVSFTVNGGGPVLSSTGL